MIEEIKAQQEAAYKIISKTRSFGELTKHKTKKKSTVCGFLTILLGNTYNSAKLRGLSFNLSLSTLIDMYKAQNGLCAISGLKMTIASLKTKRINNYNISIDRIDSSKGYLRNNIQLVCASINIMKLDHSPEEFIELCKVISENNV